MPAAIQGTGAVLLFFAVSGSIFFGIGLGVRRLFGAQSIDTLRSLQAFWTGLAAAIAILQVWHLFLTVTGYAFLLFAALGAAGLLWSRRLLIEYFRGYSTREARWL